MSIVPWQIRESIRGWVSLPKRTATSISRSMNRIVPPTDRPVLNFGGVLDGLQIVHGGRVKLLDLKNAFETDAKNFNILYLVSSAIPPFAEDLVKHCQKRGVVFVWNQNGVGYPAWAGAEAERFNRPMRNLLQRADYVIYQSRFCKRTADKFLHQNEGPHVVLHNPVDTKLFRPPVPPLSHVPFRILCIGTHSYADRILHPIRALAILRRKGLDATLTIAGRCEWRGARNQIRKEVERFHLDKHVFMAPPYTREEAVEIYQSHHLLLHPKYMDPCPTVVAEALACGMPVIGSASGGMTELVPRSCGVLIDAPVTWDRMITPSPEGLSEAVLALIPKFDQHQQAARQHAQKSFHTDLWIERHQEIFESLLGLR